MLKQSQELSKIPHIIVGTPGRVTDLINKHAKLKEYLQNLQFLVLDEADRLFEPSMFIDLKEVCIYEKELIYIEIIWDKLDHFKHS